MLLLCLDRILVVCHITLGDRISEDTLSHLRIVDTEGCPHVESLERIEVEISISEHSPVSVSVVLVSVEHSYRVVSVRITSYRSSVVSVKCIYRNGRVELKHVLEKSSRCRDLSRTVYGEVLTDLEDVADKIILGVDSG